MVVRIYQAQHEEAHMSGFQGVSELCRTEVVLQCVWEQDDPPFQSSNQLKYLLVGDPTVDHVFHCVHGNHPPMAL